MFTMVREEVIFVSTNDSNSFKLWLYLPVNLRQFKILQFNQKSRSTTLSCTMYITFSMDLKSRSIGISLYLKLHSYRPLCLFWDHCTTRSISWVVHACLCKHVSKLMYNPVSQNMWNALNCLLHDLRWCTTFSDLRY